MSYSESDYSSPAESTEGEMEPHTSDEEFLVSDDEVEGGRAASPDHLTAQDEARELLRDLNPDEKGLVASRTVGGKRRSGRARRPVQRYIDPNAHKLMSDNGKDTPKDWEKNISDEQTSTDSKDSTYVPGGFEYDDDESDEEEEDEEEEPSSEEEEEEESDDDDY